MSPVAYAPDGTAFAAFFRDGKRIDVRFDPCPLLGIDGFDILFDDILVAHADGVLENSVRFVKEIEDYSLISN